MKKTLLKQLVIIVFSSVLIACAGSTEQPDPEPARRGDCIHEPSIRGYRVLDEQNLIVEASGRRKYHVVLARRAFGLSSSWGIVFDSPTSRVCERSSEIMFDGQFRNESIRIASIRELTPEEEEHLLIRFGKKEPEIRHTPAPQEVEGADVEELDTVESD